VVSCLEEAWYFVGLQAAWTLVWLRVPAAAEGSGPTSSYAGLTVDCHVMSFRKKKKNQNNKTCLVYFFDHLSGIKTN